MTQGKVEMYVAHEEGRVRQLDEHHGKQRKRDPGKAEEVCYCMAKSYGGGGVGRSSKRLICV